MHVSLRHTDKPEQVEVRHLHREGLPPQALQAPGAAVQHTIAVVHLAVQELLEQPPVQLDLGREGLQAKLARPLRAVVVSRGRLQRLLH